jgi:hypothetical protein
MTSHGFGGVRITSAPPLDETVTYVAEKISLIEPIVWAHAINKDRSRVSDEKGPYDIVFEFDELDKPHYQSIEPKWTHQVLKDKIESIPSVPGGHTIHVDLWVIGRSLHNGF